MKILFLSQYYPPEVGAPQNRLSELAVRLNARGYEVEVLTAMPNYPQMAIYPGYRKKIYCEEIIKGIKVKRVWLFASKKKNILCRLLNYFSFVIMSFVYGLLKVERKDVIFVESPPLFLGITAILLSFFKRSDMIFNVSDLWPESAEKLGIITNKFLLNIATVLEECCYKRAMLITGQTQGICKNIAGRFPDKKVYWLKNGVDIKYFDVNKDVRTTFREVNHIKPDDFVLLYGGILGYAQGLEVILFAAEVLKDKSDIKFVILGNGPEKAKLLDIKNSKHLDNVLFLDAVQKEEMQSIIMQVDATVIPLKKLELFKGAIPSKIFESLALKRPVLLGVEGEAYDLFIEQGKCGLGFIPEDYNDLAEMILYLYNNAENCIEFGNNGLKYVSENFNRDKIAEEFITELSKLNNNVSKQ